MNELQRVQLAHEGMRRLFCSEVKDSEELFKNSRNLGPDLNAGFSFVQLVRAVMSFDDEAMDSAYKSLENTESYCEIGSKKVTIFSSSTSKEQQQMLSPHDRLHCKTIVADCILFEALLVFLKQGLTSYVKGGYLLRKAYKMYEKIFEETEKLCKLPSPISKSGAPSPLDKHVGTSVYDKESDTASSNGHDGAFFIEDSLTSMHIGFTGLSVDSIKEPQEVCHINGGEEGVNGHSDKGEEDYDKVKVEDVEFPWHSLSVNKKSGKGKSARPDSGCVVPEIPSTWVENLDHEDARLRGAVYFGYGLMNIVLSLIPPKLMKLANLFGFHGDRRLGLEALEFSCNSQAMKAPLARCGLLWYHTVIRPFFALDGEEEGAGTEEATRLLDAADPKYPHSAFFLFFRGKVRYLRCQLPEALEVYKEAARLSKDQREIEHIVLYEQGWIHFLQLEYDKALECYVKLKNETRWSACYYAYLSAIISGVLGNLKQAREFFLQATKLVKRKNNNLEKFCSRRGSHYKHGESPLMAVEMLLFAVEVIYLWRALPFCSREVKRHLLDKLSAPLPAEAQAVHKAMRAWLRGGLLSALNNPVEADKSLREALRYDGDIRNDKHILSFSLYELGMLQLSRNEYARARNTFSVAKENYTGYEFEARLNFKVHSAMSLCQ